MAILRLPIDAKLASFRFQTQLDTTILEYDFHYNSRQERWFLTVRDTAGNDLLTGRPINVNLDLLGRFQGIDDFPLGLLVAVNFVDTPVDADEETFGEDVLLVYQEDEG